MGSTNLSALYNWEFPNWPIFTFEAAEVDKALEKYERLVQPLVALTEDLPAEERFNFIIETLVTEAANTSSIEGEFFQEAELKSSIINNLSNGLQGKPSRDLRARGISELVTLVRNTYATSFSIAMLKYWHNVMLGHDRSLRVVGDFRRGPDPMQIISGSFDKQTIHFQAPPASKIDAEMNVFVKWVDREWQTKKSLVREGALRAGIAHIYFESIHPFEDGNGRIGRVIMEKLLGQGLGMPVPFSLSRAIQARQNEYYSALELAQSKLDVTEWLLFFLEALCAAVEDAVPTIKFTVLKTVYFRKHDENIDDNHRKALLKMFAAGHEGFQGGMSARKYGSINRVSRATATRDLTYLVRIGALNKQGAGRSTHYVLPIIVSD